MTGLAESLRTILERLDTGQKTRIVLAVLATLGLIWGVSAYATRIQFDVLFSGIEPEESARIAEELATREVPYKVTAGGRIIEAPAGQIDELRMELAGEGLPRGGGVGFEIFDKPSFGLSDFVQNVNYRRALERELARSVQTLDTVQSARVHLALPPKTVFADQSREPSASVIVRLHGSALPSDRLRAITHLVASGVEGLDASNVSVVDSDGRMLTDGDNGGENLSASQLESKSAMESRIESILVAIVEPVVGAGNVRARATVELETAKVDRIEERYDPDGAVVRSEQKNKMTATGTSGGGVPGTASNVPGGSTAAAQAGSKQSNQGSTTNFEINKTTSTITEPRGKLLRKSVAVVVDNVVRKSDGADSAAGESDNAVESVPRTAEDMRKITDLVRAAVGIDETRGDVLIVENIPFDEEPVAEEIGGGMDVISILIPVLRYITVPLAVLLIVMLVVRPGIAAIRSLQPGSAAAGGGPMTVSQMQAKLGGALPEMGEGGSLLRRKLIEAASEDPAAAALVVRGWFDKSSAK